MQTPKPRNGSSEVPQRTSPVTPKKTRSARTPGSESDSATPTPPKMSADRSPKVPERRSPRSPVTEKRRLGRLSELESQIALLQEDLKKAKDQLGLAESSKMKAQQEAEEARKQLSLMTAKLEDCRCQLEEFSAAEEARLQELRKISQDRDRAWESEIDAIHKQHSMDSTALTSAMNEIHRLKMQLEMVVKSEAVQAKQYEIAHAELQNLKQDMAETPCIVENLKVQLRDSEKAKVEAWEMVNESQQQLEVSKTTVENLRSDGLKLMQSFNSTLTELQNSRSRVNSLDETLQKMQANQANIGSLSVISHEGDSDEAREKELQQLRSSLEAAEIKHQEEHIKSMMQIRSSEELVERIKIESERREVELKMALNKANAEIFELKASLNDTKTLPRNMLDINNEPNGEMRKTQITKTESELEKKLMKSMADIAELKANLMDKETELQSVLEENDQLKSQMGSKEAEIHKSYEAAKAEVELAKAAERDSVTRLGYVTEEADKSSRRAARVAEQLDAAQAVNSEMETELRRIKVQSEQWRKAAEAAAAVLSSNNGQFVERTSSMEPDYHSVAGKLLTSPFSDLSDDSPKKKNSNMLKKIGGLWRKAPK